MTYIEINGTFYQTDTLEQVREAALALAEAGLESAPVYAAAADTIEEVENGAESIRNGQILWATKEWILWDDKGAPEERFYADCLGKAVEHAREWLEDVWCDLPERLHAEGETDTSCEVSAWIRPAEGGEATRVTITVGP